ncbi:hypothetical protein BHM03_00032533 [Ensete ventricosum]|nr:hypothetical protein BHM03_00032533 [Ensete ventricosum]
MPLGSPSPTLIDNEEAAPPPLVVGAHFAHFKPREIGQVVATWLPNSIESMSRRGCEMVPPSCHRMPRGRPSGRAKSLVPPEKVRYTNIPDRRPPPEEEGDTILPP